MNRILSVLTAAGLLAATPAAAPAPQLPTLPSLLIAAGTYVAQYERHVSAMLLEEDYVQTVNRRSSTPQILERRLKSALMLINTPRSGWVAFRDVTDVDGQPVHDRQDRLQKLFSDAPLDALDRARAIADEGARFNLGSIQRNLNHPTMALLFLRRDLHGRSRFSRGDSARVGSVAVWILEFREMAKPSLIEAGSETMTVSGRFWIEPETGRVWRSQVTLEEERSTGTFDVAFEARPGLDVLVPASMEETLSFRDGLYRPFRPVETITGRARYTSVRQFSVEVNTVVKE